MNPKVIIGIVAALLVAGISAAIGQTVKTAERVSRLEEAKTSMIERQKEHLAETKEIARDIKELSRQQAETNALLRELAQRGRLR